MWQARLQSVYDSEAEWLAYDEIYGLAGRLDYSDPQQAWQDNPLIQGSVNPSDYQRVK